MALYAQRPAFPISEGQGVVRKGAPTTRANRALLHDAPSFGSSCRGRRGRGASLLLLITEKAVARKLSERRDRHHGVGHLGAAQRPGPNAPARSPRLLRRAALLVLLAAAAGARVVAADFGQHQPGRRGGGASELGVFRLLLRPAQGNAGRIRVEGRVIVGDVAQLLVAGEDVGGGQQRMRLVEVNVLFPACYGLIHQAQAVQLPHFGFQLAQARVLQIGQQPSQIILVRGAVSIGRKQLRHLVGVRDDGAQVAPNLARV